MPTNEYMQSWRRTDAGRTAVVKQRGREKAKRMALESIIKAQPDMWHALFDRCLRHQEMVDDQPKGFYGGTRRS